MITFKELNNNFTEYNLIKIIINYVKQMNKYEKVIEFLLKNKIYIDLYYLYIYRNNYFNNNDIKSHILYRYTLRGEMQDLPYKLEKRIKKWKTCEWEMYPHIYKIKEKHIEKYVKKLNLKYISSCQKLSCKFIEKYKDDISWTLISFNQKLNDDFIKKYENELDFIYLPLNNFFSEEMIDRYKDKINWRTLSEYQYLSEKILRKYSYKDIDWMFVSLFYNLTDKFKDDFKDKLSNL